VWEKKKKEKKREPVTPESIPPETMAKVLLNTIVMETRPIVTKLWRHHQLVGLLRPPHLIFVDQDTCY